MIPKVYVAFGAFALAASAAYGLVQYGRALERADNNALVAAAVEEALQEQTALQAQMTAVVDHYYETIQVSREYSNRLQSTINELRGQRDASGCETGVHATALPAVYRVFNEAADHPALPDAVGTRVPDAAGDGFDAIQACFEERHHYALRVVVLQDVIKQAPCIKIGEH